MKIFNLYDLFIDLDLYVFADFVNHIQHVLSILGSLKNEELQYLLNLYSLSY